MIVKTGPNTYVNLNKAVNFRLRHDTETNSSTRFCVFLDVGHDVEDPCDLSDYIVGVESVTEMWFDLVQGKFEFALENGHPYFNAYQYMEEDLSDEEVYALITNKEYTELKEDEKKQVSLRLVRDDENGER